MRSHVVRGLGAAAGVLVLAAGAHAQDSDPRVGLRPGWFDAGNAASNIELLASVPRPPGFFVPGAPGDFLHMNSDIAFQGDRLFLGNFWGFQIFDISKPGKPRLITAFECPGGQGDMSVHGDLLFMSVEMPNGHIDCATDQAMEDSVSATRFRGVRIFDVGDLQQPRLVGGVQTCRGSYTHTLVPDPNDAEHVYIYVSGAAPVRPAAELEGCSGLPPDEDPNTAYFRIEVIRVPLAEPQAASIVNAPRIFADPETGAIAGLWAGGDHGQGTQHTATTDQCHDITVYPEIGLAAGACSGNGILLDISDPASPVRIDEVVDPNFAYWHSATFNNDASKVLFTDEWGGGMAPHCRATDPLAWGADAVFELDGRELRHVGYYKLPAPQTELENCVAHNGSLIPVPGRDIMVQAWYQGGLSVFDFTDAANPVEIAYFDRGPQSPVETQLGGYWSAYWYNGHIYGSEIGRGLDVFELQPSEHLTANEIEAARLVRVERFNPQTQERLVWPASFVLARAYLDQLARTYVDERRLDGIRAELDSVERLQGEPQGVALTELAAAVRALQSNARAAGLLAETLDALAARP